MKKRGLSTVITTMIIILLVLVAVGIVWVVVKNVISDSSEEISLGKLTANLKISNVEISGNNINLRVQRTTGKGDMTGLKFIFYNETDSDFRDEVIVLDELESQAFSFTITSVTDITEIQVFPILKSASGSKQLFGSPTKYNVKIGSDISSLTTCNNGSIDIGEVCENGNLNGQTCITQGFTGGSLTCSNDCQSFITTSCNTPTTCNNGSIDASLGEICDGNDFGGNTCVNVNSTHVGGTLTCSGNCLSVTEENCIDFLPTCNDNNKDTGEACDGSDLGGQSCTTLGIGFTGGTLTCANDCSQFNTNACFNCGNNLIGTGETCDGSNLGGNDCTTISGVFTWGVLTCHSNCLAWNITNCNTGIPPCDFDIDGYQAISCGGNDCDDFDDTVYPGATPLCDGKDNNCDGWQDFSTDEDKDLDGVLWCGGDCDDDDPLRFPGNQEGPLGDETCSDGIDNDCDFQTDNLDISCQ